MATASVKKEDTNDDHILICGICKLELKKPKLLECQHSFCTQCLIELYENGDERTPFYLNCPTCQQETYLDEDTVDDLPDNYLYTIIKEAEGTGLCSNQRCTPCSEGKQMTNATHKCLDCGDTLCQRCNKWHCRYTATKHHIVVALSDLKTGKFKDEFDLRKVQYCDMHSAKEHKVPMSSYCDDCKCLVCVECMQGENDHVQHRFLKIQSVRVTHQQELNDQLTNLERSERDQEKRANNLERAITDTKQKWNQQETDIYDIATKIHAIVDDIKNKKLAELKTHYEKELEYLDKLLKTETNKHKSLQATVAFSKMFLKKCSDSDFLYHEDDVTGRIDKSQRYLSQRFGRNLISIENEDTESLTQAVGNVLGKIEKRHKYVSHKCKIGQVKKIFKRKIDINYIYGLSYNPLCREILLVGFKHESGIILLDEDGCQKRIIQCEDSDWCSDVHFTNYSDIYFTVYLKGKRKIVMIDRDGTVKRHVLLPDDDQEVNGGLKLEVDTDNSVFISSYEKERIYRLPPNEDNLLTFKSNETDDSRCGPTFLCLTPADELVISNYSTSNVHVYSKEGELQWQYDGLEDVTKLQNPEGICCDDDGYIYVVDKGNCKLHVLHDQRLIGVIPIDEDVKPHNNVPLIITPEGHLIYGFGNEIVKIAIWENDEEEIC